MQFEGSNNHAHHLIDPSIMSAFLYHVSEALGSACIRQTSVALRPSPEWTTDSGTTISGSSEKNRFYFLSAQKKIKTVSPDGRKKEEM